MLGYEALEIARKNPGTKIRQKWWNKDNYVEFRNGSIYDEEGALESFSTDDLELVTWEIVKEEPKLITWYRPRILWVDQVKAPTMCYERTFHKTKCPSNWYPHTYVDVVVLEWETIEAAETWEEQSE